MSSNSVFMLNMMVKDGSIMVYTLDFIYFFNAFQLSTINRRNMPRNTDILSQEEDRRGIVVAGLHH